MLASMVINHSGKQRGQPMKQKSISQNLLLIILMFFLAGCTMQEVTPEPATLSTATLAEVAEAIQEPTSTEPVLQEQTSTPEPTLTPTEAPLLDCTIAFESDRDGNWEVYRMDPNGENPLNLSNNPADDFNPAWSPDGKQIVFVSNRENDQGGGQVLYVTDFEGSAVRQLTTEGESNFPDWSNDGTMITYSHQGDIYVIPADGSGESVNLTNSPEEDSQPVWSPDSQQIAWLSGQSDDWNIFLMNADGSDPRQVTTTGGVSSVTWTIDGRLFTNWRNSGGQCSFNCVMDPDGSNIIEAGGKGEIQQYLPFWTLDGERVECASINLDGGSANEIYLVGEIFPDIFFNLTNHPANDRNPDWPATCGPRD
jgi:dipeptidyl aminopeptidase/acylaminoacyl peptidase